VSTLLVIQPDGTAEAVPNTYEAIRDAFGGEMFDFVRFDDLIGAYVLDMAHTDTPLNTVCSWFAGGPLWGPCVVTAADPGPGGETLPPPDRAVQAIESWAMRWRNVVVNAQANGQDVLPTYNPDTAAPPEVITWDVFDNVADVLRQIDGEDG